VQDLGPLRYIRSITAPLTPGQARRFRDRFGVQVLNCYGQTELGGEVVGWTAADLRDFGDRKLGAVGRPHAGVTVRVLGEDGHEVPARPARSGSGPRSPRSKPARAVSCGPGISAASTPTASCGLRGGRAR
jgi:acyl-coenzyme A synthetase/AMP-(fatty) acid ligase